MSKGYIESFKGRMRDELINESLSFGLNYSRSATAEWAEDYNNFRPHSSLGYTTRADYTEIIAATHSKATRLGSFTFPPVTPSPLFGVTKTAEALIAADEIQ